ncbi:uncharacterized protein LOC118336993 [Morone saxatilis]|uniref:uncharacterized protein LOC118336993 n=1 Tax=Morone saxatilis TaxID=34816 RepID=UPI0015E1C006|nr:uncharacterized protein LOC118336993 [Morone saxatilis]
MAEVRQRLGRGAYDFTQKTCVRFLLETQTPQHYREIRAPSLSAAFLWADIQNGEPLGAGTAAGRVTVGDSQGSYTRVTPLFDSADSALENGNTPEHYCYFGLHKGYSLPNKPRVQNTERNPSRCQSYAKFRRTFCTFGSARRLQSPGSRPQCCGHVQSVFIRAYSDYGAKSEPLYKTKTGYYEILQVTPTATQGQIKTAYYKQSFVYHPDRNAGSDEATLRFSEISEAYTVLGNKALRKKYDLGLLSLADLVAAARPSAKDPTGSTAKQQTGGRRSAADPNSPGGIFDFDNFFKAHYNEQLQREREFRARREEMLRKKQEESEDGNLSKVSQVGVWMMLAMAVAVLISLK